MNANKAQKWNVDKHQQSTTNINKTHKWALMNNKTQKGNVDEQQQSRKRGRRKASTKHNKEQCNNTTRNASKIQTMNINQAKQKKNFKLKTHKTFSLFIKSVRKKKRL
jgi:hypothetical protein